MDTTSSDVPVLSATVVVGKGVVVGGLYTSIMSVLLTNCNVGFKLSENAEWFVKH